MGLAMDKRTKKALRDSIAHWEKVVADPIYTRIGRLKCALCIEFRDNEPSCNGCPIAEDSGPYCSSNYYYLEAVIARSSSRIMDLQKAARGEVRYLESLLPEEDSDGHS